MLKRLITGSLALILTTSLVQAETLYVQSQKAYLMQAPKFNAGKLLMLKKGDPVESIQRQGNWYQVTSNDSVGWLSKLLLKPHPPLEKVSILARADADFKENVRRRSSSIVTAGAARGLASEERSRIHQQNEANYYALKQLESLQTKEQELTRFSEALQPGGAQ